jgi:chromosomal replication initiator protein
MNAVQIIPFSGRPLDFEAEEGGNFHFSFSEHGYLLGQENRILEPLIQEIVDGKIPPERLPVLIYGTLGTGRTHLLKGLLETWRKNQTNETVRRQGYYLTCSDFYRQYTEAVATRMTEEFRRRFHRAKLILFDDLEQLVGKPSAQGELRRLLDDFTGIMVITAQTLPSDWETNGAKSLSRDLTERIQAGTTIPLFPPGEAVRQRFLRDLASALRIPFTESLLNVAIKDLPGTIPLLYAAVVQKHVEAKSANEPADTDFWLKFSYRRQPSQAKSMTEIAKQTALYFSLKLNDLKGGSRCKTVALARCLAVYLVKTQLHLTFKEIGHFFGKRDPSTVRHLFEKVQQNLQTDTELRDHLFRLQLRFQSEPQS